MRTHVYSDFEYADALSRSAVNEPTEKDQLAEKDVEVYLRVTLEVQLGDAVEDIRLSELKKHCGKDDDYLQLKKLVIQGFPPIKKNLPDNLRQH